MASVLRRLLMTALSVGLTAGAVVASASLAAAADEDVRVYEGQYGGVQSAYTARCAGDACVLTADDPPAVLAEFLTGPLTVSGGSARAELPNTCGTPDGGFDPPRTLALTLTSTDLTATVVTEKGKWRVGGMLCISNGSTDTIRAEVLPPAAPTGQATTPAPGDPTTPAPGDPTTPAPGDPTAAGAPADSGRASSGPTTSRLASGEPDAPSVLSALRTSADIDARDSVVAALLTIVLVLLIAFPTTLLNSAAEQGSDRFSTWWRRHRSPPDEATEGKRGSRWWWAAGGVLAAGVVSCFVDPQFGLNAGSLRTVLSVLVGFAAEVVLGWLVVVWLVRRSAPGATASYAFQPLSLLLVAAAVVFTRWTGFEPGIIFGLVAGVGFTALVGRAAEARVALVPLAYGAAVALLAWAGYHLVADATGTLGVFVAESLSAAAVAGLAALPIALFPVAGMPGARVFAWSRRVWAACYAFGLFAFFVVLLPTPYSWDEVGWTLKGWVLVYLAYLAVALTTWWVVRRGGSDGPADSPTSSSPEPEALGGPVIAASD